MSREETKAMLKDIIFESVMTGTDIRLVIGQLHFVDGYEKELILEALNEMQ
jgi:hypothetical protein